MTKTETIKAAIAAGILNGDNIIAFNFSGNYIVYDTLPHEVIFEHIVNGSLLHWTRAA